MASIGKFAATLGCAAMAAVAIPVFATANQSGDIVEATHFVSSGRVVNAVAGVSPDQQAQDRAAIWALTQQASTPETCAVITANEAPCFGTFQTGSN